MICPHVNEHRRKFIENEIFLLVHSVPTSGQQILFQQRGNLVITQPLVTVEYSLESLELISM